MSFTPALLRWYKKHKRDLPWRKTKDPYSIWLSEIILQQTRVNQGLPYFLKFIKKYPDIKKLSEAKLQDVLKLWQGLGYYSRARNMHHTATDIVKKHNEKFPPEYAELLKLKGVGEYTAAAIASISFGKPHPVVDGNVVRVLSRYFGIKLSFNSSSAKNKFVSTAAKLMGKSAPSEFNQAMMEFGALQCVPKNPVCTACPFNQTCFAFTRGQVDKLPVKKIKPKIRHRYLDYLVIPHQKKIYLRKRTENDIWKNLFDFPVIESKKLLSVSALKKSTAWKNFFKDSSYEIRFVSQTYPHQLSHQLLNARFWSVRLPEKHTLKRMGNLILADKKTLKRLPLPRLIERFLETNNIFEN